MKMEQEKLLELIERSRQGEASAQEALVLAVQNRVYYHCKKMLKKEEDAQDATQDVLITMLTSLDKLKEPAAFWGWVNGITANRCRHLLSAPRREWQVPEDEEGNSMLESVENLDETLVPEKALDNEETRRMILGLVDDLPPEQRMSVLFYYYDEMSVKEIAQAMDVSEGTVKSRLNYARRAIKSGVEDYERKGVKLYSVSPILLLLYFLRQEAAASVLDRTAAAAMAGQVLAQAGAGLAGAAASGAAGTAAAGTSPAVSAGSGGAGGAAGSAAAGAEGAAAAGGASAGAAAGGTAAGAGAAAAAAGISGKVIAAVLAGAVAVGGAVAGISSLSGQNSGQTGQPSGEVTLPFEQGPDAPSDPTAFGAIHGFTLVEPQAYEGLPVTIELGSGLTSLPSRSGLTEPQIFVSEPDDEGYVTYTVSYTALAEAHIAAAGSASLSFSIMTQDYNLYDWYTGQLYFPDERMDTAGEARAVGSSAVDDSGESRPITFEKRWTSGMDYGDWTSSSQPGADREIQVDAFQDVTFTVRVPDGYDGILLGVNIQDAADPQRVIQTDWDLAAEDPSHYEFVRLSDYAQPAPPAEEGGLTAEAAAAYAAALSEDRDLIDAYVSWYEGILEIRPVALADVWGDGTPELIYVAADPDYPYSASYLTILTFQDGQTVPLLRESWDFFAGSNLSYTLFQGPEGKTLYADTSYFASSRVTERYVFSETADALSMEQTGELPETGLLVMSTLETAEGAMTPQEAEAFLAAESAS